MAYGIHSPGLLVTSAAGSARSALPVPTTVRGNLGDVSSTPVKAPRKIRVVCGAGGMAAIKWLPSDSGAAVATGADVHVTSGVETFTVPPGTAYVAYISITGTPTLHFSWVDGTQ